jgi:hypothetical protein
VAIHPRSIATQFPINRKILLLHTFIAPDNLLAGSLAPVPMDVF